MKKFLLTALLGAMTLGASAATQDFEWSYANNPCPLGAIGTGTPETYRVAVQFNNPNYAGMKITKIDCYLNADESTLKNIDNTQVFMASTLSRNMTYTVISDVEPTMSKWAGEATAVLSLTLDEPYVITEKPIYLGYNLDVTSIPESNNQGQRYPVLLDKSVENPDALWMNMDSWFSQTEGQWTNDWYETGAAIIVATIEREVYANALGVAFPGVVYSEAGKDFEALLTVSNNGESSASTIGYKYSVGENEPVEKTLGLDKPLAPGVGKTYQVLFPMDAVAEAGEYPLHFEITSINGEANDAGEAASVTGELDVFSYMPRHIPLVEEYTALACGYCPRGYVAMEYLGEEYPDDAVVICYHLEFAGNKDPMTVAPYAPVNTSNYPTASIDRVSVIDPYYGDYETYGTRDLGIVDDLFRRAEEVAIADIQIRNVEVSLPDSVINVTTDVTFMKGVDDDRYRVGYVLTCDGLYSPTWKQTNYFSRDAEYANTPLIEMFYRLPSSVYGLTFNDVAINTSAMDGVRNSLTDIVPNQAKSLEYSFDVKNVQNLYRESLNPYIYIHRMWVNAFIVDKQTGIVVNAAKFPVRNVYDSVETVGMDGAPEGEAEYFDLQGRRVVNPDKGVFVKMVDGKAVKVIK